MEMYFQTPSIRLHGTRKGSGPLVVYLHGITANWSVWQPVLDLVADRTTGVSVSQRGHGLSDHPADGYGSEAFASDTIALIEALRMGPAIIVGHSLGARNGVVAGHQRPDLVSGVLSVDFVPYCEQSALDALASRVAKGSRTFESLDEVKRYLAERYPKMPADAIERRALNGYQPVPGGLAPLADADAMNATAQGLYDDYEEAYRQISVPVIAVRGRESMMVSQAAFDRAKAVRPDIEHVVVEGVDHYVPEEDPQSIARLLAQLLQATSSR